ARPRGRRAYTMGALLGDALALVDAVAPDGRVHLVGHDWGAIPSWLLAIHHPDRVASLTAVSVPHPAAFLTAMLRSPQVLHSWYMLAFQLPFVPELVLRHSALADRMVGAFGMTEEDAARFRTEIVEYGALPTALNWYRALPFGDPRLVNGRVTAPTTMVWSDEDAAVEGWGPQNSDRWVDAPFRFVALEGVSHWIPTHAAEVLAETILDQVGSVSATASS
ncbi:MAG TPA: alpha/beta fold hydrolase, partial [Nocardioides sp.]|nr:alpha/beta fold hydrolase [Nocardioides sp.]